MPHFHFLQYTFSKELKAHRLPKVRSSIAALAEVLDIFTNEELSLFHNHSNDENAKEEKLNRYPLIQYRIHDHKLSLVGINEGAEALRKLNRAGAWEKFLLDGKKCPLEIKKEVEKAPCPVKFLPKDKALLYKVHHYIPFNPENYPEYDSAPNMQEKLKVLERVLSNQLLALCNGIGCRKPDNRRLQAFVYHIDRVSQAYIHYHDKNGTKQRQPVLAFDLVFGVNVQLPDQLAIGRQVALGYGWFYRYEK